MGQYSLTKKGKFIIEDYNNAKEFASFFPGVAGKWGIPMWVFYVNRAQCIASFGIKDKDNAIMEFLPANKAYRLTAVQGFRTFLKMDNNVYEPFKNPPNHSFVKGGEIGIKQRMIIDSDSLEIEEVNKRLGLRVTVSYFTIANEPLAGLARELKIENISKKGIKIEVIDGMPLVLPYGINDWCVKHMSRTIEAWTKVENLNKKAPFYRLIVDPTDRPEVVAIKRGNFYFAFSGADRKEKLIDTIVDPDLVFGTIKDFSVPAKFMKDDFKIPAEQFAENKTPCAFSYSKTTIASGRSYSLYSMIGNASTVSALNKYVKNAAKVSYFEKKSAENKKQLSIIKNYMLTNSASKEFDMYCGQTFLDNVLRGGLPVSFGYGKERESVTFHIYSRKHGDLERDYNNFSLEPAYLSQGNGNYRDVNQNRRNDIWFNPNLKDANILTLLNLIQADGCNPLVVKGTTFRLRKQKGLNKKILSLLKNKKDFNLLLKFLEENSFSAGQLITFIERQAIKVNGRWDEFLGKVLLLCERTEEAEHHEGYWSDHWTYNTDLLENFLSVYPDKFKKILLNRKVFTFYDSAYKVADREDKYVIAPQGVRQFGSVVFDKQKDTLIKSRRSYPCKMRKQKGKGNIYKTTLIVKLLSLAANKLVNIDPEGVGVEMEADKPNWYDALNGLPGLFGSSISETFELKRLLEFLREMFKEFAVGKDYNISIPVELDKFINKIRTITETYLKAKKKNRDFIYWQKSGDIKEEYRNSVFFGFSGEEKTITVKQIDELLELSIKKLGIGIRKGYDSKKGLYYTYFVNEVKDYKEIYVKGRKKLNKDGLVCVRPLKFKQYRLPFFLEGIVHAMKTEKSVAKKEKIYKAVRKSELFDKKLGMYKVCANIKNESDEIGRANIFTPGWLENESIWLHMEYKYLLELLRGGLYEQFYNEIKTAFVPFQNPELYGRSILENSSFIVSSVNPDKSLHGRGFVARLSGSTAEFLHIWLLMVIGERPFYLKDNKLNLVFKPKLKGEFFTKKETEVNYYTSNGIKKNVKLPKNTFSFNMLGKTLVVYHNGRRKDTFGKNSAQVKNIKFKDSKGKVINIDGNTIPAPYAVSVRNGDMKRIDIELR